ncbi:MAG: glutamine--fructose-6-phosphate transaminase (isomerizing) [Candidatus Cloacimonetes bacterium]|nr:glutamine--fructose-6-phosphate transaminase (isomerizing) [Candidatus Cloacimonadota bacterium]
MCGIVGYIGNKNAVNITVEALKRLEYRGYDSSGVASISNDGNLLIEKKKGKIRELEQALSKQETAACHLAIAHTRWATHGEPNENNAHPHSDNAGVIALVHNGIIENYKALSERLKKNGSVFKSETDTEVLAHLIGYFYKEGVQLIEAVRSALKLVEGTYGIAVVSTREPNTIIAARKGSPLIMGIGKDEYFIASDVSAIIIHTKKVIYLQDEELVSVNFNGFDFSTLENETIQPTISEIDWDAGESEKGTFKHYMLKEIFEQSNTIENAYRGRLIEAGATARLGGLNMSMAELHKIKKIILIACGTSYHTCILGKYLVEKMARVPVQIDYASEFRYRNPIIEEDTLVFVISQSGETADTIAALREAQAKGARVMGITNGIGSTISRETDGGIYIHAGMEVGVASTKAFTSQVTILYLLGILFGRMRNLSHVDGLHYMGELKKIPEKVDRITQQSDKIREIAKKIVDSRNALFLGRDVHFPVALEGALKLKEISYIHAEGYPAAEMKHGPIALIDEEMPVVAIAMKDVLYDKVFSNLQEVKARKGRLITIASEGDDQLHKISEEVIYIPHTIHELQPLLSVIPLQLLAYHVADLRGLDVDQPRNLAKSVTVE